MYQLLSFILEVILSKRKVRAFLFIIKILPKPIEFLKLDTWIYVMHCM